jgi:hypothetical protein
MVVLYVRGLRVGPLTEVEDKLTELLRQGERLEFKTEAGEPLGAYRPEDESVFPWQPDLSNEEVDRMIAEGGGMSLKEFWKSKGVE